MWIPEISKEYSFFKFVTQENEKLIEILKRHVPLNENDRVLDVGGRDGNISFALQNPSCVDIIDPDPEVAPIYTPRYFWRQKMQDVCFDQDDNYKLIICCHVLGYLGFQNTDSSMIIQNLLNRLVPGGTLVLFYNTNEGYMGSLRDFSQHILPNWHYDFFDERCLNYFRNNLFEIKTLELSFPLSCETFEELSRCCWFLFGAMSRDINYVANLFLPKLRNELIEPTFPVQQKVVFIKRPELVDDIPTLR